MNTRELLEKGNQRVLEINKLMGELEDYEGIMDQVKLGKVSISAKGGTTYLERILPEEKMEELKGLIITAVYNAGYDKINRYKELIGIQEEKAAVKKEPAPVEESKPELTVELVRKLYIDQDLSIAKTGEALGIDKNKVYRFIKANNLTKPNKKERELYRDAKVESARRSKNKD